MRFLKLTILAGCLLIGLNMSGQDLHFTQFNMSPLTLNPALTGNYLGSYRVGGIYRNQWASIIPAYSTPSFYVDAPIITGFRPNDWIGVGVVFVADKAGTAQLGRTSFLGSVAYHLGLNKKGSTVLTLGLQGGRQNRTVKLQGSDIKLGEELGEVNPVPSSDRNLGQNALGYFDINAGLTLKSQLNKQMNMIIGFSMAHINKPKYAFDASGPSDQTKLAQRYVGHGEFNMDLNKKWTLSPSFIYQSIAGLNEMALQGLGGYKLIDTKEKKVKLNFGLGYRLRDAAEILVGMDYNDIKVGFAWDANTSGVTSKFNGGYELAVSYIGKIYKKPKVNTVIFCPRF